MSNESGPAPLATGETGPKKIAAAKQVASAAHSSGAQGPCTPSRPVVAHVLRVEPGESTRWVVVRCPHCGEEHNHSWPVGMADVGPRIAPCSRRPPADLRRSYWVETSGGAR